MAYLKLNTLEPVDFGGRECAPQINAEVKLRLSRIKKYDEEALSVIAEAFPDDEEYVRNFLDKMVTMDVQTLHAYLLGGQTMVETLTEQMNNALSSITEKEK